MKKKSQKWTLAICAAGTVLGGILFQTISYLVKGTFNYWAILGSLMGTIPLIFINAIYVHRKKDNTPEVDERIRNNMIKYIAYASQIVFLILMATLAVISFMGIERISIMYLWIIVLINMFVIGIGAMIVKHR